MRTALAAALSLALLGCASAPPLESTGAHARIDHLIIGVADLEQAIEQIEDLTGVRPSVGGVHPGRGTRNALMSLGDGAYLELLAPDPAQALDNQELRELRGLTEATPLGWAVSADDAAALRQTLAAARLETSATQPGSRRRPDGSTLHWVTFGFDDIDDPLAPFFIVWSDLALHPSRTAPSGCSLALVRIAHPSPERLRAAMLALRLDVAVTTAAEPAMHIALDCPKGRIALGHL